MQKGDRREFLKKLIMGAGVGSVVATSVVVSKNGKKTKNNDEVLYTRSKNWEFYYKQAN